MQGGTLRFAPERAKAHFTHLTSCHDIDREVTIKVTWFSKFILIRLIFNSAKEMLMKKVVRSMVIALGAMTIVSIQAAPADKAVSLSTPQDKLSYALGIETGKAFKTHDVQITPSVFAQGLEDGVQGNTPLLTDSEVQKVISSFQQETLAKMQQQMKQSSEKNQKNEAAFLSSNKGKSGIVTTDSGLQYKIIKEGSGATPTNDDMVTVDYEGKLLNGKVFDSSYQRGKPATFPVGAVIAGWQEALKMMKPGAEWELYIPSKLAYGEQGAGGIIGPNELLIFKVHLISVSKKAPNQATPTDSSSTTSNTQSNS